MRGRPRKGALYADGIRPKRIARSWEDGRLCIVSRDVAMRLYKRAERLSETEEERYDLQCLRERLEASYDPLVELYLVLPEWLMTPGGQADRAWRWRMSKRC